MTYQRKVTNDISLGLRSIGNHIVKATQKLRRSLIDRDCLIDKIQQWKGEDPSPCRPKVSLDVARKTNAFDDIDSEAYDEE